MRTSFQDNNFCGHKDTGPKQISKLAQSKQIAMCQAVYY